VSGIAGPFGPVAGHCDGYRNHAIQGWAWYPEHPDVPVEIELLIDEVFVATTTAENYRADLRKAGIGEGRHGWRFPFSKDWLGGRTNVNLLVRVRGGVPLAGGVFVHPPVPSAQDRANPAFTGFIARVLGLPDDGAADRPIPDPSPPRPVNILLYAPPIGDSASLGQSGYSYGFVAKAYHGMLRTLVAFDQVSGPVETIEALHAEAIARGEGSIVLSFFPPQHTALALRAPLVPVIAWEYPTLPDGGWTDELSQDWRFVLRQAGRVVVASEHSAAAIRSAMGSAFPVAVIPHPIFDRVVDLGPAAPHDVTEIAIDGFIFDPAIDGLDWLTTAGRDDGTGRSTVSLDGVVFASVFAPRDGRKAWQDTVTAFVDAHRDNADATLLLKMISSEAAQWRWELHEILSRERAFACRIVVLHGYLDDAGYARLVAASHWIVSATLAEGQCLPLLEFMSAGRPAITAAHTAMADYATTENALLIRHDEEPCAWPQDPSNRFHSHRAQLDWGSLRDAFHSARKMVVDDWDGYVFMADSARETMRGYCSDAVVAARLDAFLGLGLSRAIPGTTPMRPGISLPTS